MSDAVPPPLPEQFLPPPLPQPRPRWRWAVHLALLTAYVLGLGMAGVMMRSGAKGSKESAMPGDLRTLAIMCGVEVAAFAAVFFFAWLFSRARREELYLQWRGKLEPVVWGIIYSVLLRVAIAVVMMAIFVPIYLKKGEKALEPLRPKTEATVNMKAMKDPLYVAFAVTVVSFVMAGFREELWRAGMLAGLAGVAPDVFGTRKGQYGAVFVAAIIFGLGHLPQGIGGVAVTAGLGFGLGWIMVRHQSAWEAILAHGFFDASTFAALYVVVNYFPESLKGLAIFG
ncbi:MAG TPA: CPBP family intramembrane glutamic endopeptidase [Verrucomicrobiae bacterium]